MAFAPKDTIKITKLDAARRQLRTAIELWFADGDPVSIHVLAFSAHEIIHRLYKLRGLKDLMFDSILIKDEYRNEFAKMIKEDVRFFKHADTDPNATRDFNPLTNLLFLLMSVIGIERMGEKLGDVETAFNFWNYLRNPHWFPEDVAKERIPIERLNKMRAMEKRGFLEAFLEVRREQRVRGLID